MPPKKGEAPKQPPLIGRFGTSLKIGIVGLPNVGYVWIIGRMHVQYVDIHMCVVWMNKCWAFTDTLLPVHHRKSTFFNVLTKSQAAAENFPFCTIDPNESRVPVPDERFDFLCQYHKPARFGHCSTIFWQSVVVWSSFIDFCLTACLLF